LGPKPESAVLFDSHAAKGGFPIKHPPIKILQIIAGPDPKLTWGLDGVMNGSESDSLTGCAGVACMVH